MSADKSTNEKIQNLKLKFISVDAILQNNNKALNHNYYYHAFDKA